MYVVSLTEGSRRPHWWTSSRLLFPHVSSLSSEIYQWNEDGLERYYTLLQCVLKRLQSLSPLISMTNEIKIYQCPEVPCTGNDSSFGEDRGLWWTVISQNCHKAETTSTDSIIGCLKTKLHDVSENKLKISIKLIVKGHGCSPFCPGKRPYHVVFPIRLMSDGLPRVLCRSRFSKKFTTKTHGICRVYVLSLTLRHFKVLLTQTHVIFTQ